MRPVGREEQGEEAGHHGRCKRRICPVVESPGPPCAAQAHCEPVNSKASRSEEHTSELQSLMRISYAVFCLKKTNTSKINIVRSYHNRETNHTTPLHTLKKTQLHQTHQVRHP